MAQEVAGITMYRKEHKVTYKSRLAELKIPIGRFMAISSVILKNSSVYYQRRFYRTGIK